MTRWRWALLIFELFLIALILVLPQVDLPDFTFHGGNAPVAAKARLSPVSPSTGLGIVQARMPLASHRFEDRQDSHRVTTSSSSDVLLALLCTLLC
jgi:hypothetical protein